MERQAVGKVQKTPARGNHHQTESARSSSAAHPVQALQRSIGNQAVQRLLASPYIQTKLQVSTPGDPFEQEADRVADTVMRMPQPQATAAQSAHMPTRGLASGITRMVQRVPLAVREDEEKTEETLHIAPLIQRLCTTCEEEKQEEPSGAMVQRQSAPQDDDEVEAQVQTKAAQPATPQVTNSVAANIKTMNGGGSPLPETTRAFFEPRFGADFSQVRVHADARAEETAKSINARAFTVGRHIAFGAAQYAPESTDGKRLLAHELTHVVQQKPDLSSEHIQKDDADDEPDEAPKGPKELLEDRLEDYEFDPDNEDLTSKQKAEIRRVVLLLLSEIERHDHDPEYTAGVISLYPDLKDYVADTISNIEGYAASEEVTIDKLIMEKNLPTTSAEFAWNPFFAQNVAAFPDSFLKLATELLDPPYDEGNRLLDDAGRATTHLERTREQLPEYLINEGLPVGRELSLTLSEYELIKGEKLRSNFYQLLMKRMPTFESDLDFAINLEKKDPPTGFLAQYQSAWIGKAISLYGTAIFANWNSSFLNVKHSIEEGNIEAIDPVGLRAFQQMYPQGLTHLDDLLQYSGAAAAGTGGIGNNPFDFYNLVKLLALPSAAQQTSDFIAEEHRAFQSQLSKADAKVRNLSEADRLGKALSWSVKKGFAAEGIMAVVDNFGNLLTDILEEKVKKSIFRRVVSFVASLHPLGRLAVLAYNIYETVQNVKDALDIVSLIQHTVATIDAAKNASSIVALQSSAAHMSKVYEEIIPLIAQKISAGLAKKLMKGSDKKQVADDEEEAKPPVTKATTPHDRKRTLEESKGITTVDKLISEPKYLLTELDAAAQGRLQKSKHPDYEVEVTLPNDHVWRRNARGVWCRFSNKCVLSPEDLPEEMRKQLEQLDKEAEEYKEAKGEEDHISKEELDELSKTKSDHPPGFKKPKSSTTLGTFMHSKDYTRFCHWLDTAPGRQWLASRNLTHADLALQNLPTGNVQREFKIEHPDMTGKPRADVVDWDKATVHEIKPTGSELLGFTEAQQYAEWMNKYHKRTDGKLWVAGRTITYDGQKILDLFTQFGYFEKE